MARSDVIRSGPLTLSRTDPRIELSGQGIELTPVEHAILLRLASQMGEAVTRAAIVDAASSRAVDLHERNLDVHISRLRKKLGKGLIQTVWAVGYRLVPEGA